MPLYSHSKLGRPALEPQDLNEQSVFENLNISQTSDHGSVISQTEEERQQIKESVAKFFKKSNKQKSKLNSSQAPSSNTSIIDESGHARKALPNHFMGSSFNLLTKLCESQKKTSAEELVTKLKEPQSSEVPLLKLNPVN